MNDSERQAEKDYRIAERLGIDESPETVESKRRAEKQVEKDLAVTTSTPMTENLSGLGME